MDEQIEKIEKVLSKMQKNLLTLTFGTTEQKLAYGEYEKLLHVYNDLLKTRNEYEEKSKRRELDEEKNKKDLELREKELELKTEELELKKSQEKNNSKKDRLNTLLLVGKGVGGLGAAFALKAFEMSCFNNVLNKSFEYESTGVITSTGTKMVLSLFKPKL